MVLLIITILATSASAGGREHFDNIFQKFQTSKGLNVQRKVSEKFASNRVASERDLWVGGGSLQRSGVPHDTSQAFQRLEFISQVHKGSEPKQKDVADSKLIAKEFSKQQRNQPLIQNKSIRKNDSKRKSRVENKMNHQHQQHHHQHHQQQVNGERVGEMLRGARSAIEASSSPLVGASRLPIQPNSPPLAGIHTSNGPRVRMSFEQTMAQFGFRPRILQLAKGAGAPALPLSPGKDLVKGKDRNRAPPLTVSIGKGSNNDGRKKDETDSRSSSRKLGLTQNRNVFTAFSNPSSRPNGQQPLNNFGKSLKGTVSVPMKVERKEREEKAPVFTAFSPQLAPGWVSYSSHSQEIENKKMTKQKENGEKATPSTFKADRLFPHSKRLISDGKIKKMKKRGGGGEGGHLDAGKPFLPTTPSHLSPAYEPFVRLTRKAIKGERQGNSKTGGSRDLKESGKKEAVARHEKTEDGFALDEEIGSKRNEEDVRGEKAKSVCDILIFDVYRLLGGRASRGC